MYFLFNFINYAVSRPAISDLVVDLKSIKANYHMFGVQAGVPPYDIDAWEVNFLKDADRILEKILGFLLDSQMDPMKPICDALEKIDKPILANKLRLKYGGSQGNVELLYVVHNDKELERKSTI